jgi:bifunctional non-homologous end joining protein LigD
MSLPLGFIAPCLPTKAPQPPTGDAWLHEIKHDGFRVIARKDGDRVRLYSRPGNDVTYRFPLIVEALVRLRTRSCIIDGDAVCCGDDGVPSFDRIRYRRHDASVFLLGAGSHPTRHRDVLWAATPPDRKLNNGPLKVPGPLHFDRCFKTTGPARSCHFQPKFWHSTPRAGAAKAAVAAKVSKNLRISTIGGRFLTCSDRTGTVFAKRPQKPRRRYRQRLVLRERPVGQTSDG